MYSHPSTFVYLCSVHVYVLVNDDKVRERNFQLSIAYSYSMVSHKKIIEAKLTSVVRGSPCLYLEKHSGEGKNRM